jgi:hypothetical protein
MSNIRSRKVLDSARGQPCAARFPGICNGNAETTVWAHLNGAAFGKGTSIKAHDVLGFHACFNCHRYYDIGHGTTPYMADEALLGYVLSAVCETWVRLIRSGIVTIPEDAPKPFAERPTKPRKPKAQRRSVGPSRPMQSQSRLPGKGEVKFPKARQT